MVHKNFWSPVGVLHIRWLKIYRERLLVGTVSIAILLPKRVCCYSRIKISRNVAGYDMGKLSLIGNAIEQSGAKSGILTIYLPVMILEV